MRGKLRDKRTNMQRDYFKKRDLVDRHRLNKRNNRTLAWLNQQLDEDGENYLEDDRDLKIKPVPAK